jgi:hypothetical protein
MATTPIARRSRAARGADQAKQDAQPGLKAVPSETPKPKPAKPAATVDLGAKPVTMYFPTATLASGEVVQCAHQRYGHESEASARKCIGALAVQRGHRVA